VPGVKRYADLQAAARSRVRELMPWDVAARLQQPDAPLLLDVREPAEYAQARIAGSVNVPRGVLEAACEWDHDDTEPALAGGRERAIVVVCRSGQRSLLAAETMTVMGFVDVVSLRTGVRGWNDAELPLVDAAGDAVDPDRAQELLAARVRPEQRRPQAALPAAAQADAANPTNRR
jgi:rhodanese-related sulfurtransferase